MTGIHVSVCLSIQSTCAGKTIRYVPGAANAREPWFELGLNRCGAHASAPDSYRGGWCDPGDQGQMSRTDLHTTTNYMVSEPFFSHFQAFAVSPPRKKARNQSIQLLRTMRFIFNYIHV
jgi:hypothetical protein